MTREIIRPLAASQSAGSTTVTLLPGTVIHECRILATKEEPYLVEFQASNGVYTCPLYYFQPRTHAVVSEEVESMAVRSAALPAAEVG